ncbi:MAG: hydrogenase nickel incorporation protein HypB [Bacteroidales bacterium]|jgi:hydrogenase nickel incorporation protein HypB|nr:hydrogenase nickel incorporation protein HypB [Bacteroidales bacterium]
MCGSCGCGEEDSYLIFRPGKSGIEKGEKPAHFHVRSDQKAVKEKPIQHQSFETAKNREIKIEEDILSANKSIAEQNRDYFKANNILALNLVSSPGSGKTSLLETTIQQLSKELSIYVIEGDQQTQNDAERIHKAGAPVIQINTGQGCHLDASMITNAVEQLQIKENSILFIENVGNLVCPALFDLGEKKRVIIISVTEGEDKPLKYPTMFQTSDICIINKTDLLPYVDFEIDKLKEYALRVNPKLIFIDISVKNGEGVEKWYECLREMDKS